MARLFYLSILLICSGTLSAQGTYGTEFWCGFMENLDPNFNGPPDFVFEIDATVTTNGFIEVPATGLSIPFTAIGGEVTGVQLPDALWYSEGTEFIDNKGIRITTDEPVNINAVHFRPYFSESTRLLNISELSTEYLVSCAVDFANNSPTEFVIVSTANATEIEIIPSVLTQGLHPANIPFTVILDEGQNYQVKAFGDLTGSSISSLGGEEIAVFSGAQQGNVGPCSGAADSHLYDQSLPTDQWHDLYHFVPFFNQGEDPIVIVASADNTDIFFDCIGVANLDEGQAYYGVLGVPTIISATNPISVTQLNSSQDCNPSGVGDPNMLQLFPADRQLSEIRIFCPVAPPGAPFNFFSVHYTNLVIEAGSIGDITLDGASISGQFSPFPGDPNYYYAQIPLSAGAHFLSSTSPFYGIQYGFGDYDGYTSNLGYEAVNETSLLCLEIEVEGLFCTDSLLSFSALSANDIIGWDWSFGDSQLSNLENPMISYDMAGIYLVTLEVVFNDGTTGSTSFEIEIFDCPPEPCEPDPEIEITFVGEPCSGLDFSFIPVDDYLNYNWAFGDGSVSDLANPSYTYISEGIYMVTLEVTNQYNCMFIAVVDVEVPDCNDPCLGSDDVGIFISGTPCVDSILTFSTNYVFDPDNPPFLFDWEFSTGDIFFFEETVSLSFSNPGIYTVEFEAMIFPDCEILVDLTFEIFDDCNDPCVNQPDLSIQWEGDLCLDSLVTFSALTNADLSEYLWTFTNGPNSNGSSISRIFTTEGTYELTLTATDSDGCTYEETIEVLVKDCDPCLVPVNAIITYSGELCAKSEIQFFSTGFFDADIYFWDFGDMETSTENDPIHIYNDAGLYTIYLSGETFAGCSFGDTLELEILPCLDPCTFDYKVDLLFDGSLCLDSLGVFSVETDVPEPDSYTLVVNGGDPIDQLPAVYQFTETGALIAELSILDVTGCVWTDELIIEIGDCLDPESCQFYFPNAFSPNGDGTNETFGILYECPIEDYRLLVFDRWGNLVFKSIDPDSQWDGFIGGKPAASEVYAWKVAYFFNGEMRESYGDLTLLR